MPPPVALAQVRDVAPKGTPRTGLYQISTRRMRSRIENPNTTRRHSVSLTSGRRTTTRPGHIDLAARQPGAPVAR